jgi:hypothetical protein
MWLMMGSGTVSLVSGIVCLCAPRRLLKEKPPGARVLFWTDAFLLDHRVCAGICLIASGLFCLSSAFYVWLRLNLWRLV